MPLIKGENLTPAQRRIVLSAFVYRWTVENRHPFPSGRLPKMAKKTDDEWLRDHAFYFVKDGSRLMANRKHCEPHYMAD